MVKDKWKTCKTIWEWIFEHDAAVQLRGGLGVTIVRTPSRQRILDGVVVRKLGKRWDLQNLEQTAILAHVSIEVRRKRERMRERRTTENERTT